MSKPLTIDELKALQVGDWVWVDKLNTYVRIKEITEEQINVYVALFNMEFMYIHRFALKDYGTKWLAYKNKEQAEGLYDKLQSECDDKERYTVELYGRAREAECELKENKEQAKCIGEIVKLPCIRPIVFEDGNGVTMYEFAYFDKYGMIQTKMYRDDQLHEAERHLAELKGE